jgi:hypothetical protein
MTAAGAYALALIAATMVGFGAAQWMERRK